MVQDDYFDGFFSEIERLKIDKEGTTRFFFVFSRFEFALKEAGYLQNETLAKPNWETFRNKVKNKYVCGQNPDLDRVVDYLCNYPVGKQQSSGERFLPMNRGSQSKIEYAISSVEVIRNNLFHGGKFPTGPVIDIARNSELLAAGLTILAQCLKWDSKVRHKFFELE